MLGILAQRLRSDTDLNKVVKGDNTAGFRQKGNTDDQDDNIILTCSLAAKLNTPIRKLRTERETMTR
jgi:hypothetical protein